MTGWSISFRKTKEINAEIDWDLGIEKTEFIKVGLYDGYQSQNKMVCLN